MYKLDIAVKIQPRQRLIKFNGSSFIAANNETLSEFMNRIDHSAYEGMSGYTGYGGISRYT
jgi:hypothetical protein